jgi:aryl-alcohol dehydrogenase-like predicted oxidoreductase
MRGQDHAAVHAFDKSAGKLGVDQIDPLILHQALPSDFDKTLAARRLDRVIALADELGNGSIAIEADVTNRGSIVAAADRVRRELGTADALVNNAGVMLLGPFDSDQRVDYRQMIEVHVVQAFDSPMDEPVVNAVQKLAEARGVTTAQIALAWVLRRPAVSAPIVRATEAPYTSHGPSWY